jgi:hypothetical protein
VLPASGSDVRLVLEANVRATQMAFVHNERTLAIGMRMAETLREGVQTLTEAQSEWIKAIASTRGFFRNTPPLQLAPPAEPSSKRDDEDEDEDKDKGKADEAPQAPTAAAPADWLALVPTLAPLAEKLLEMLTGLLKKPGATPGPKLAADPDAKLDPDEKLDMADFLDWRRAYRKSKAGRAEAQRAAAAEEPTAAPSATSATSATVESEDLGAESGHGPAASSAAGAENGAEPPPKRARKLATPGELLAMLPPKFVPKLMAVRAQLTPDEGAQLIKLMCAMPPEDLRQVSAGLGEMSTEEIVALVRTRILKPPPAPPPTAPPSPVLPPPAPEPSPAAGEE